MAGFDVFAEKRGLALEAIVVGGAALGLLDVIARETRDCDVLHPELSEEIIAAAAEFAAEIRARGGTLADDWLNNGPISLHACCPMAGAIGSRSHSKVELSACSR